MFWNPVPNDIVWYTHMDKEYGYVMIKLKQVLQTGLEMIIVNENNNLPIKYNK